MGAREDRLTRQVLDTLLSSDGTPTFAPAVHFTARVAALRDDGTVQLHSNAGENIVRVGASCLLSPAPGDLVAAVSTRDAGSFVIAVLERGPAAGASRLSFCGDVELSVSGGNLSLTTDRRMSVSASECVVEAGSVQASAARVSLFYRTLDAVGEAWSVSVGQLKLVGSLLSCVFDREQHFARLHLRTTEGLDQVRAQSLDYEARDVARLHAENVLVTGSRLVKTTGGQIHMG